MEECEHQRQAQVPHTGPGSVMFQAEVDDHAERRNLQ